jgi:hypothetical protein
MASGKVQLDEEDFPLAVRDVSVMTREGHLVATAPTPGLADDLARRLNEDALRRHEGNWSA